MNKFFKIVGIIIGVVVLLGVVLLVALNLYVQGEPVRGKIEESLGDVLGRPASITRSTYSPWGGFKLSGIEVKDGEEVFLQAKSFQVKVDIASLFGDKLVITEVILDSPELRMVEDQPVRKKERAEKDEKPAPEPTISEKPPVEETPEQMAEETVPGAELPVTPEQEVKLDPQKIQFETRQVLLKDGVFIYVDTKGKEVARFEGIEMKAHLKEGGEEGELEGVLDIRSALLIDKIEVTKIHSPFEVSPKGIFLKEFIAEAGEGTFKGSLKASVGDEDSPQKEFQLLSSFRGVNISVLGEQMGLEKDRVTGLMVGHLNLKGEAGNSRSINGNSAFILRKGTILLWEPLQMAGTMLKIEELRQTRFEIAQGSFNIQQGVTEIQELTIQSQNLRLEGTGTVESDGELDLNARLHMHQNISRHLSSSVEKEMTLSPDMEGFRYLDFVVTGPISSPSSNLMEKLVGEKVGGKVNEVLKDFLKWGSSRDSDKGEKKENNDSQKP